MTLSIDIIMKDPVSYVELTEEVRDVLESEAYISACELDSPNSFDFEKIEEDQFKKLEERFWNNFVIQRLKAKKG